jgi:hypothetical protein
MIVGGQAWHVGSATWLLLVSQDAGGKISTEDLWLGISAVAMTNQQEQLYQSLPG